MGICNRRTTPSGGMHRETAEFRGEVQNSAGLECSGDLHHGLLGSHRRNRAPFLPVTKSSNTGQRSCTCCLWPRSVGVPVASTGIPRDVITAFRPHSALNPYNWSAFAQRCCSNSSSASSQWRQWASVKSEGCGIVERVRRRDEGVQKNAGLAVGHQARSSHPS